MEAAAISIENIFDFIYSIQSIQSKRIENVDMKLSGSFAFGME